MPVSREVISPALLRFPRHANLIGEMVIGYTDLEITFCHAAGLIVNLKFEVLHAAENIISEIGKLKVINALARNAFKKAGLEQEFRTAYNMMSTCATIRNRYAHAQWVDHWKRFYYVEGKGVFEKPDDDLPKELLTLPILREQRAYFVETRRWVVWLEMTILARDAALERTRQTGHLHSPQEWTKPKTLPPPRNHAPAPKEARGKAKKAPPSWPPRQRPTARP